METAAGSPEVVAQDASRPTLLVVEDDAAMRRMIEEVLSGAPAEVVAVESSQAALDYLEGHDVAVVVTDLRMPRVGGLEVLRFARRRSSLTQVILLTGHATVESAVDALKNGAYDYLKKPFEPDDLRRIAGHALEYWQLNRENLRLREANRAWAGSEGLVGKNPAIEQVRRTVRAAAGYDCCVLVTGESGTGKEVVAHLIHAASARREGRFVPLNCAAIPENIIESELFGYQRGAFTGADRAKAGLFETADRGTLFLDEINNASPAFQAKLLRVLQDGTFYRMGDTEPRRADVRLIAATNRPLPALVESGAFRMDLYYRLRIVEIVMPPLRDRRSDIPLLANYFLGRHTARLGKPVKGITTRALGALMRHDWPGNARELENAIQSMIILTETDMLDVDCLPPGLAAEQPVPGRAMEMIEPQSLEEIEAYFIAKTLRETQGNRATAAEILGIDKSTLWRKIKRYGLE
ncbi:MAG: sigma-54-dependent Fis family transcriptional regulator [Burkholderiales bacterium]|nr:sigma-54-dependent Fis family transcriptional regulator [Burkholderiales bacterium]